jgi:hypothetical protein
MIKTLSTQKKERIPKAEKEKTQVTYKGKAFRIIAGFSTQNLHERRSGKDVIQALKENTCQPRLLYQHNYPSQILGETKISRKKEN